MSTPTDTKSTNPFPLSDRLGGGQEKQCLPVMGFKIGPAERGDSIIEIALALESARQSAEYWLNRWSESRRNPRFLARYIRSLRACDRLTNQLVTP